MKILDIPRPLALASVLVLCSMQAAPARGTLPLSPFSDQLPARYTMPMDVVFKSARDYRALFGHDAPGVNFEKEWVVLHSAGLASVLTHVSIEEVRVTEGGNALNVTTLTDEDICSPLFVAQTAYGMAKIPAQDPAPSVIRFTNLVITTECAPN